MMMFFLLGIEQTRAYFFTNIDDSVPISKLTLCIVIVVFDILALLVMLIMLIMALVMKMIIIIILC